MSPYPKETHPLNSPLGCRIAHPGATDLDRGNLDGFGLIVKSTNPFIRRVVAPVQILDNSSVVLPHHFWCGPFYRQTLGLSQVVSVEVSLYFLHGKEFAKGKGGRGETSTGQYYYS